MHDIVLIYDHIKTNTLFKLSFSKSEGKYSKLLKLLNITKFPKFL